MLKLECKREREQARKQGPESALRQCTENLPRADDDDDADVEDDVAFVAVPAGGCAVDCAAGCAGGFAIWA